MTDNHKVSDILNVKPTNVSDVFQMAANDSEHSTTTLASLQSSMMPAPTPAPDVVRDDSLRFILVPLAVLLCIIVLSALVYLMARNRRRLAHIYCKRKLKRNLHNYTYEDDSDVALEQGDEYDDVDDDPTECLLKGKLQIDNSYESNSSTFPRDAYA